MKIQIVGFPSFLLKLGVAALLFAIIAVLGACLMTVGISGRVVFPAIIAAGVVTPSFTFWWLRDRAGGLRDSDTRLEPAGGCGTSGRVARSANGFDVRPVVPSRVEQEGQKATHTGSVPVFLRAGAELAAHVLVATLVFVVIATADLGLETFTRYVYALGDSVPSGVLALLRYARICIYTFDIVSFSLYLVVALIRFVLVIVHGLLHHGVSGAAPPNSKFWLGVIMGVPGEMFAPYVAAWRSLGRDVTRLQ